ncbi:MAG TPA: aspartate/glutamate racemase family protein [Caulobacter sp.]|nr:aspartate/glutamate racemase family protein [Caulobacter sp.]
MKTIGLIGGVSWESTAYYYQQLNRMVRDRLGGRHSVKLVLVSVDFAPVEAAAAAGLWDEVAGHLVAAAKQVEAGGADCLLIGDNTMHNVAADIRAATALPLIHIGDATADALKAEGARRPLLLGTRYTMEMPFLRDHLSGRGVETVVPDKGARDELHRIIFDELVVGKFLPESKAAMLAMIEAGRREQGADAVIFGCTELGLLATPDDSALPVFDTAEIHARAAIDFALA